MVHCLLHMCWLLHCCGWSSNKSNISNLFGWCLFHTEYFVHCIFIFFFFVLNHHSMWSSQTQHSVCCFLFFFVKHGFKSVSDFSWGLIIRQIHFFWDRSFFLTAFFKVRNIVFKYIIDTKHSWPGDWSREKSQFIYKTSYARMKAWWLFESCVNLHLSKLVKHGIKWKYFSFVHHLQDLSGVWMGLSHILELQH